MMKGRIPGGDPGPPIVSRNRSRRFPKGWNNLATAYDQNNQKDEAVEAWTKAYDLDQNYNAAYNLAKNDYENDHADAALDWIRKAILEVPQIGPGLQSPGLDL